MRKMQELRFKVGNKVRVRANENSYFHKFADIQKLENEHAIVTITRVNREGLKYYFNGNPYYNIKSIYGDHCLNDDNLMWSQNKRLE
jgi:hypothetical protein